MIKFSPFHAIFAHFTDTDMKNFNARTTDRMKMDYNNEKSDRGRKTEKNIQNIFQDMTFVFLMFVQ